MFKTLCHLWTSVITYKNILPSATELLHILYASIDRRDKKALEHYDFLWEVMEENLKGIKPKKCLSDVLTPHPSSTYASQWCTSTEWPMLCWHLLGNPRWIVCCHTQPQQVKERHPDSLASPLEWTSFTLSITIMITFTTLIWGQWTCTKSIPCFETPNGSVAIWAVILDIFLSFLVVGVFFLPGQSCKNLIQYLI